MISDLWTRLYESKKNIVVYGMGNGADKIADELEKRNMFVSDYFASDGFVRGHSFRGKRVLSFAEIKEKYDDFIILVAFASSLPEVIEKVRVLDRDFELYIPDVPVVGGEVFDKNFYEKHKDDINKARSLFADEESVRIFDSIIEYKLTGKFSCLESATSSKEDVINNILRPQRYKSCVDLGAYNGDSVREFISLFPFVEKIYSFEPDRRNFKKLEKYVVENSLDFVKTYNCAVWNDDCQRRFDSSGNRNSRADKNGGTLVQMQRLDTVLDGALVDYIKYDVEGSEYEALQGSLETIEKSSPDLLVSLYHRNEDIFKLPIWVNSLNTGYKLYLRRFEYFPAWDLNLYAIKE